MDRSPTALFDTSLDLYQAAREAGELQVAYHALAAGLHAAEGLADPAACESIERHADECRGWIDANRPTHPLATPSSQSRGHESIFKQLTVMAESTRLRLIADALKKKGRAQRESP